ncbi:MAG: Rab family GTPase [Promethearchaeota archaeon]
MKKIVLIGPAEAGKTSLRLLFFENYSIIKILKPHAFEPTMGIQWYNYDALGTTIGVVDTSGQEIIDILGDENLFFGADIIIFMFDLAQFLSSTLIKAEYMEYLFQILLYSNKIDESFKIEILAHKIDLIPVKFIEGIIDSVKNDILSKIEGKFNQKSKISIHFTSFFAENLDRTMEILNKIVPIKK